MALTAKKVYAILKRQISDMEAKLNSPVRYRGTVATADLLPLNPDIGDMYNIESKSVYGEAGMNVAWNGVVWDTMGAPIDMSLYLTKEEAEAVIQRLVTEYFEKNPVKPGATTEQAQQIEQNKTDIASLKTETGSLKEDLSNKITKFYASSKGETHLADSDNGKIMDMMLYGKSEQKQYSGKNLLNYDAWKDVPITRGTAIYENNGITLTATENDCYSEMGKSFPDNAKIKVSEGETLTLSWEESENKEGNIYIFGNGIVSNRASTDNRQSKKLSYTVPSGVTFITFRFGVTTTGDTISYKNIQIEKGSEPTTYEPYTGGIPSPNPDYPQEIKSVVNPTVKVCGKNLLELPISNKSTQAGITFEVINDSVIKITGINDGSRVSQYIAYNSQDVKHAKLIPYKNIAITISTYNDDVIAGLAYWLKSDNYATVHYKQNKRKCTIDLGEDAKIVPWFFIPQNGTYTNDTVKFGVYYGTDELTYDAPKCHTVTLPYTLNAIPVNSGGNVTIDGQQYIADYVDVERGKRIKYITKKYIKDLPFIYSSTDKQFFINLANIKLLNIDIMNNIISSCFSSGNNKESFKSISNGEFYIKQNVFNMKCDKFTNVDDLKSALGNEYFLYDTTKPEETDLTEEELQSFKLLQAYYPTTNIFINSEQLDGYTVFNYPISMQNGWNYVKQQIGDTREYIYDMDARTQDTDLQAAEAYVNSEYAVALTELEV